MTSVGAQVVDGWAEEHPQASPLAELLSLAVHVEPALLRAARLALRPMASASAEADVWFSPLVDAASPSGFTLRRDVAEVLRERLAKNPDALQRARHVVEHAHAIAPETIRLQEEVIWLALRGGATSREQIGEIWKRALATILRDEKRAGAMARWALRAVASAPAAARDADANRLLQACAAIHGGAGPPDTGSWLPWMADEQLDTVPVAVRLVGDGLELTATAQADSAVMNLPATDPPFVEVAVPGDPEGVVLALREDAATVTLSEVQVWQVAEGEQLTSFGVEGDVVALALQPGLGHVAVALADGRIELVEVERRARVGAIDDLPRVRSLRFEHDGASLAAIDETGGVWRTAGLEGPWTSVSVPRPTGLSLVHVDSDGTRMLGVDPQGALQLVDVLGTVLLVVAPAASDQPAALADTGSVVAVLATDEVRWFGARDGWVEHVAAAPQGAVHVAASESGVLVAGVRGAVFLHANGEERTLGDVQTRSIALTGDGRFAVTAVRPHSVELRAVGGERWLLSAALSAADPLRATYRLQLGPGLGFDDVRALVPYLRDLGISHLYLSPALTARSGSTHGYDVVDPTRVSEALGGEEGLRELAAQGLRIILDIVPNHMGTGDENRWWSDEAERVRVFDVDLETGHYRRFFDIDDLAGVRVEDPEVFELTHRKVLELLGDGVLDGLRIDHLDGLADPAGYLERLRDAGAERVWVEKILLPGEQLRDWPVQGTVGYEFLNEAQGLFVDPAGEGPLTALYGELVGDVRSFEQIAVEAQLEQATTTFSREIDRLARLHDPGELEQALARLPVYRTYVRGGVFDEADHAALRAAGRPEFFDGAPEEFVSRFQQTSPPVKAKGIEDTAFSHYLRLLALNDVGGDPGRWGVSVDDFHGGCEERARRFPRNLLTTQTHDTRRSGDARARVGALSAMAAEFEEHVRRWYAITRPLVEDGAPDDHERWLVFQTLVAVWPIAPDRLEGYLDKALREANRNTNWVDQDHAWEVRVERFAVALLTHKPFLEDFEPFVARVAAAGERSALGQLVLKLTVPGVPDVYQGDELIDLSLVNPDNRHPVDWDARRAALAALRAGKRPTRETMKLHVLERALDLRARRPELFVGAYESVEAGAAAVAFTRGDAADVLVVVVLREPGLIAAIDVPPGRYRDVLSYHEHELDGATTVGRLVGPHGLALLERV